jgi:XTP/dITP diphosphohydrolase
VTPPRLIVLATSNAGKVRELELLVDDWITTKYTKYTKGRQGDGSRPAVRLALLREVGGDDVMPEPFATFRENAAYKARTAAQRSGEWALGEDSGLQVDALGGRPGVYSARFAGRGQPDARRVQLLLEMLRDVEEGRRTARFRCAVALASPEGMIGEWEGVCEGRIAEAARGEGGFGYDPIFVPEGEARTMAELTREEKNSISHRGRAMRRMAEELEGMLRG